MVIIYIVIVILVIVNIVAFSSAVWVSYDKWKTKGEKDWLTPFYGLFFLPMCVFIAIAWPFAKYREFRRKEERMQQKEETKKYHLQRFSFRLKDLPFEPSPDEVIYVESEYNDKYNQLIKNNIDYIISNFKNGRITQLQFVYLPNLVDTLLRDVQSIRYNAPYNNGVISSSLKKIQELNLLDYLLIPENRSKIIPCFARFREKESDYYLFDCVGFCPDNDIDEKKFLKTLCSSFDCYLRFNGPVFQTKKHVEQEESGTDVAFDEISRQIMLEVEERVRQLRKRGISQWAIEQLVKPESKLSRLVITKDYRILLPDYNNMEIKMEPLAKAVYLLFLNHPEGIMFKCLPDYREELTKLYDRLKPLGLSDRALQSIEDVTNPLLNSINEKCARIRGAFVGQFDDHMARHYYIDGRRGEAKKISLPRDLVTWE